MNACGDVVWILRSKAIASQPHHWKALASGMLGPEKTSSMRGLGSSSVNDSPSSGRGAHICGPDWFAVDTVGVSGEDGATTVAVDLPIDAEWVGEDKPVL